MVNSRLGGGTGAQPPAPAWEVAIQTRGSYDDVLRVAGWAEREGLAAVALPDHYLASRSDSSLPAWDHLIHFGGLARETRRIELIDLVSPITFRHPSVYAKTALTLADMSEGRFVLGLGTGWLEEEHRLYGIEFPAQAERFDRLEECLAYLHALRNQQSFEGHYYRLEGFPAAPAFAVPIVMGGSGTSRTPRLAGRYCDEFNVFPNQASDLAGRIETCRAAAVATGRDPDSLRLSFTLVPIAGSDRASYRKVLAREAKERERPPDHLEKRLRARGIPHGSADQVRHQLQALVALGISRFYLQCFSAGPSELAEIVAPFRPED